MASRFAVWALFGVVLFTLAGGENGGVFGSGSQMNCGFPAIFNFGDSNSDTGSASAAGGELLLPFGQTIGKKSKRASDGLLIIDFLAEKLGLPHLNATVDSIGTSFKYGANFATGGCKIDSLVLSYPGPVPFNLAVQISQFLRFKSHTIALYNSNDTSKNPHFKSILPEPDVFSKALYTIDIGQNDIAYGASLQDIPGRLDKFYVSVQRLLDSGAKFLWVHSTGPFGCLAWVNQRLCHPGGPSCDEHGCEIERNNKAMELNKNLKDRVQKLRAQYPDAVITYVDMFSAKYSLFVDPKSHGFDEPFQFCCGDIDSFCGTRKLEIAGANANAFEQANLTSPVCKDASKYISWDGTHYTEAANRIVANLVLNGTFSDPPAVPVTEACCKRQ